MPKGFKHLSVESRIELYERLAKGESIIEIANKLGYHKSTIYRELERNSSKYGYRPDCASQLYLLRRATSKIHKLDINEELKQFVLLKLSEEWSPEEIAGYLRKANGRCIISHETIYNYIYSKNGKAQKLYKFLRKQRKFRYPRVKRRRSRIKQSLKRKIHERPADVNLRNSFGHFEGDLILFRKTRTNLITLRERKSRYLIAIKNDNRKADLTANNLVKYMKQSYIRSLTLDNGSEFAGYKDIADSLMIDIYFCDPYKSYQKGSIENGNKLIRTKLPKTADINRYSQEAIEEIINKLNSRPMKCLDYKTPQEVFNENLCAQSGTIFPGVAFHP